ncbi:hypothetical protein DFH08DRAFT_492905 [Mycena albidolilacea]|uniref:Uncharacterized protein n=1 Tax=Mycena albidolilacea TaxID=1033008 RepID=A0AAD7EB46_9AGAR|nr:hypothetical protein DFH08DRAFT_492905 [Mycena albidolilacea]
MANLPLCRTANLPLRQRTRCIRPSAHAVHHLNPVLTANVDIPLSSLTRRGEPVRTPIPPSNACTVPITAPPPPFRPRSLCLPCTALCATHARHPHLPAAGRYPDKRHPTPVLSLARALNNAMLLRRSARSGRRPRCPHVYRGGIRGGERSVATSVRWPLAAQPPSPAHAHPPLQPYALAPSPSTAPSAAHDCYLANDGFRARGSIGIAGAGVRGGLTNRWGFPSFPCIFPFLLCSYLEIS